MLKLTDIQLIEHKEQLQDIPEGKILISSLNAHSYNTAQHDNLFAEALRNSDYLIPDGVSIVMACKWLNAKSQPPRRIVGWDLFQVEMEKLEARGGKCFFLGSSEKTLALIKERVSGDYPHIEVKTYSPPYKKIFTEEENRSIVRAINEYHPDLLWIGMTAPKQEKWVYSHWQELDMRCHVGAIGAVFDFYAGTSKRAPLWWQEHSLEWLYRLILEPRRMWKRYLIGNPLFLWNVLKEKML